MPHSYHRAEAIAIADTDFDSAVDFHPEAFIVSGAGDIVCRLKGEDSTDVTIAVDANTIYELALGRLEATGTTATGLVVLGSSK